MKKVYSLFWPQRRLHNAAGSYSERVKVNGMFTTGQPGRKTQLRFIGFKVDVYRTAKTTTLEIKNNNHNKWEASAGPW